jgi:uncharacterized protein (TIGR02996 family)
VDVEAALSKAILDEPDDDLPRLAFADWLEERGGGEADAARAEFIRAQVEQARRPNVYTMAGLRAAELWPKYRTAWFGPAAEQLAHSACERGFLSGITVSAFANLVREAKRAGQPWPLGPVPFVRASGRDYKELAADAAVARMPGLASWGGLDSVAEPLMRSAHLVNLRSLWLADEWRSSRAADLETIRGCAFRLHCLRLSGWEIQDRAIRLLASDAAFGELRQLALAVRPQTQASVVELLGSANVGQLRHLSLCASALYGIAWAGKATLRALLYSPHLTSLQSLTLSSQPDLLSKSGAKEVARWKGLARLRSLALEGDVGLSNGGLRHLAQSENVAGLLELSLSCPAVDYLPLAGSPHLGGLRRLRLGPGVPESVRAVLVARFGDTVVAYEGK